MKIWLAVFLLLLTGCSGESVEIIAEGGSNGMRHWFLFSPEPGIHCVSLKRGFGSSIDCWKVDDTD